MYTSRTTRFAVQLTASVSAIGLLAAGAFAQDGAPEEILVWGTAVQTNSLYLGEQDLQLKQADHLSDLLRSLPGVEIGGTHSVNTRISFRGISDRDLDVYIDGALQTNYMYHHMGNLLINPDILRSADIQLGANSVVSGGRGGVARFETRDARDLLDATGNAFGGRVMVSRHDNAQTSYSLTGYGQLGERFDVLAYYHNVNRDNFEDGDGISTIGSDGTTENMLVKLGFDATANQRFELSYDLVEDAGDYTQRPDMGVRTNAAITGDILLPTEYDRESINLSYQLDLGDMIVLDATYFTNDLRLWRDERAPVAGGGFVKEASSDNQGLNILAESVLTDGNATHTLRYGVQYFDQNLAFNPDLIGGAAAIIEQEARSTAVFIEDEIDFGRVRLRPGVRFNDYEIDYVSTGDTGAFSEATFGLATGFDVTENLELLAGYSTLFRGPELAEPFTGSGGTKIVNPDLEAETGQHIELGLRWTTQLLGADLYVGVNLFETTLDDYMVEVDVPGTTTGERWDQNFGEAVIDGFELSANLIHGNWDILASYSGWDLDTSRLGSGADDADFRENGDTATLDVSYGFDSVDVFVNWNVQNVAELTTGAGQVKPGYTVHNISARWTEPFQVNGLSLNVGVDNLFDELYTSHASRSGDTFHPVFGNLHLDDYEAGRNIKFTIAQTF